MVKVEKTREPRQWTEHRNTPGADFTTNPHLQMTILRDQGFTCAYCGRRIPCNDRKEGSDDYRQDKVRIEHVYPRDFLDTPAERMDFSNLVACCPGCIGGDDKFHCDLRKGNRIIHFDIFNDKVEDLFYYVTNVKSPLAGKICTDVFIRTEPGEKEREWLDKNRPQWDRTGEGMLEVSLQREIGDIDSDYDPDNILNLNHILLRQNRRAVIMAIQRKAAAAGQNIGKNWWYSLLRFFEEKTVDVQYTDPDTKKEVSMKAYPEYRAIAIHYIKKKLRKYS